MYTAEILHDKVEGRELTVKIKFNHAGIVDADYAKVFIMALNAGIIQVNTTLSPLNAPQTPVVNKSPEAVLVEEPMPEPVPTAAPESPETQPSEPQPTEPTV